MKNRLAVVDTNVVVSGLITGQTDSPPARIVDAMLRGDFPFLLSLDLLAEYRNVLLRPKIKKVHRLSEEEVDSIIIQMTANGMIRDTPVQLVSHFGGKKGYIAAVRELEAALYEGVA